MSLSVKHLNADTTFLLTFSSQSTSSHTEQYSHQSQFTILVDPWLAGSSSIWTPRFQISHHTSDPVVDSLADIALPDIILISQDKPDHCHEETLRTLPPDSPVKILAVPAAAKKIKSWDYFTHATILSLPCWNPKAPDTVHRISLKPRDALFGTAGEVTIAYIPQRFDMTNLHNAIGITYQPPSSAVPLDKNGLPMSLPLSPPLTPVMSQTLPPRSDDHIPRSAMIASNIFPTGNPASTPRPLSVLYSPHGIGIPCLTPFMDQHLGPANALPLTALFHSINVEQNPWFMGGLVATGYPGGSAIVKKYGAKYWVSAHDEAKDNRGWATAMIRSRHYTVGEAQVLLDDELERHEDRGGEDVGRTKVVSLGVGGEMIAEV